MDRAVPEHFNLTVTMLSLVGLSPYQKTNIRRLQNSVICVLLVFGIIIQLTPILAMDCTTSMLIKNMSSVTLTLCVFFKYIVHCYRPEALKGLITEVNYDWIEWKDDEELRIMRECAYTAKHHVTVISSTVFSSMLISLTSQFSSKIFDIFLSRNESQPREPIIQLEYFVDWQKHALLILIFQTLIVFCGGITVIGTETLTILLMQHISSLFDIASHRIKKAVLQCITQSRISQKHLDRSGKESLINAVIMHRRAIKFVFCIAFKINFTHLGAISVSQNGVKMPEITPDLSQSLTLMNEPRMILLYLVLVSAELIYMLYSNYVVQKLLDSADAIFHNLCSTEWYDTPLPTQKLLLFIMLKTARAHTFDLFFMYNPSIESFSVMTDLLKYAITSIVEVIFMFYMNYVAQLVLDAQDNIFMELYNVKWHEAPLQVQKLILIMMIKYSSPIPFNMFGTFSPSIPGFFSCLTIIEKFTLRSLSTILMSLGAFLRYNINWYLLPRIKEFIDEIKSDWQMQRDETHEIIKKGAAMGRVYVFRITSAFYLSLIMLMLIDLSPCILNKVILSNETRMNMFALTKEYMVYEESHLTFTILHVYISLWILMTAFAGPESLTIMCTYHVLSLCEITSYYIRESTLKGSKDSFDYNIKRYTMQAIFSHRKAIRFFHVVHARNVLVYSILIVLAVMSLSINVFQLWHSMFLQSQILDSLVFLLITTCEFLYLYYMHMMGQRMTDSFSDFDTAMFHSNWYETPVRVQKLFLNIMVNSSKPLMFSFFGFYCASMEGFSSLIQLSISYFIAITSVQ
ncbi:PREDICTED: uncharacterized protein LOC108550045 [Eufriesea mexicana]|uniref:uncharacterized protein LOC108550045 n=1 Tax=Eufriesea mexicana TaxID=516756 RepID=UPI00083C6C71|nr:PREDICTED: uncharacterized protein LOC108550045 [Eufriesea mexicana]